MRLHGRLAAIAGGPAGAARHHLAFYRPLADTGCAAG